jgi:phosphate-selective porin
VPAFQGGSGIAGAWELAIRVSALDLDSGSNPGGKQHDLSLGCNWYPGSKIRIMLNSITGDVNSLASGRFHILQTRLLYAF